jgi:hypothetical protein
MEIKQKILLNATHRLKVTVVEKCLEKGTAGCVDVDDDDDQRGGDKQVEESESDHRAEETDVIVPHNG